MHGDTAIMNIDLHCLQLLKAVTACTCIVTSSSTGQNMVSLHATCTSDVLPVILVYDYFVGHEDARPWA